MTQRTVRRLIALEERAVPPSADHLMSLWIVTYHPDLSHEHASAVADVLIPATEPAILERSGPGSVLASVTVVAEGVGRVEAPGFDRTFVLDGTGRPIERIG